MTQAALRQLCEAAEAVLEIGAAWQQALILAEAEPWFTAQPAAWQAEARRLRRRCQQAQARWQRLHACLVVELEGGQPSGPAASKRLERRLVRLTRGILRCIDRIKHLLEEVERDANP